MRLFVGKIWGSRWTPNCLFAALSVFCSASVASCSPTALPVESEQTVGSLPQEIAALLEDDPTLALIDLPRGVGKATVCASSDALWSLYVGGGVEAVTGSLPFVPQHYSQSNICHVQIANETLPGRDIFVSPTCRVRALADRNVAILVSPDADLYSTGLWDKNFQAAECFYRLALVLEGYSGGFRAPVFGEYSNSYFFAGKRHYVGPFVTPYALNLLRKCPRLANEYYRDGLGNFVRNECDLKSEVAVAVD